MTIKVLMTPHLDDFSTHEGGVRRVVEAYEKYLPDFGVKSVKPNQSYDLRAVHFGATGKDCDIAHLHGLYWTADYLTGGWEYKANAQIVEALRHAKRVTVPSAWVAETLQRDMRFSPHVVPHGVNVDEWLPKEHQGYVLWNKNRRLDVCDPTPMMRLAELRTGVQFVTTFTPYRYPKMLNNVRGIGLVKHEIMRKYIMHAMAYLSTTKETFGIGALEAMASGVPVLGFRWGGNVDLVKHGVNGYLAHPDDIEDLAMGLDYCIEHRDVLGANGREMAKKWDWPSAVEKMAEVYKLAMQKHPYEGEVSVVIPCYNLSHTLERAVKSVLNQTYKPIEILIVDDGSTDETRAIGETLAEKYKLVRYIYKPNGGVATARNQGVKDGKGELVCCLDADDEIAPQFLEACVQELRKDRSLGIAYTGLFFKKEDGTEGLSKWPEDCNYDKHLSHRSQGNARGHNQIPTCCVFRKEAWRRTGGYKQRYAPLGAGAEDAEFWARIMSIGYGAKKATDAGLFIYYADGQVSKPYADGSIDKNLLEPQWLQMHPWSADQKHPLASRATPMRNPENKQLLSHPVRQYDQPTVSIVIPVGEGHEEMVKNALDSCEAQSYRRWEAIVVFDNGMTETEATDLLSAYPYAIIAFTPQKAKGAGAARNIGAKLSRAPFLVFLDADDMLSPEFLDDTLSVWYEAKAESGDMSARLIVYSDYVQKTVTTQDDLHKNFNQQDILQFIEKSGEAVIAGRSAEYDCERAQRQPELDHLFHWCLVTCLVPKIWHEEIGGFDESMVSFEDVLYHWTMARQGMCYVRIPKQLVMYRMYTGTRRQRASIDTDEGRIVAKSMLEYAEQELEKMTMAKCGKCPGGRNPTQKVVSPVTSTESRTAKQVEEARAADDNFVLCEYMHPSLGNHHVYGAVTKEWYGYRHKGEVFLVHRKDIDAQPQLFRPIQRAAQAPIPQAVMPGAPVSLATSPRGRSEREPVEVSTEGAVPEFIAPKVQNDSSDIEKTEKTDQSPQILPPVPIGESVPEKSEESVQPPLPIVAQAEEDEEFDALAHTEKPFNLDLVPGVTPQIAQQLRDLGKENRASILAMGKEGLMELNGVGEVKADGILEWLALDK
jgi:glycosyltransferase involved in cell wall biosynthesis